MIFSFSNRFAFLSKLKGENSSEKPVSGDKTVADVEEITEHRKVYIQ